MPSVNLFSSKVEFSEPFTNLIAKPTFIHREEVQRRVLIFEGALRE
jgi:hypothetical protein